MLQHLLNRSHPSRKHSSSSPLEVLAIHRLYTRAPLATCPPQALLPCQASMASLACMVCISARLGSPVHPAATVCLINHQPFISCTVVRDGGACSLAFMWAYFLSRCGFLLIALMVGPVPNPHCHCINASQLGSKVSRREFAGSINIEAKCMAIAICNNCVENNKRDENSGILSAKGSAARMVIGSVISVHLK